MIIILVAVNRSQVDKYSTYGTGPSMHFAETNSSATRTNQVVSGQEFHPNLKSGIYDSTQAETRSKLDEESKESS